MFPYSKLIMNALYEDRKREIEHILRVRQAARLRPTRRNEAMRQVAHWVGTRLVVWGRQLQARAAVAVQDVVVP